MHILFYVVIASYPKIGLGYEANTVRDPASLIIIIDIHRISKILNYFQWLVQFNIMWGITISRHPVVTLWSPEVACEIRKVGISFALCYFTSSTMAVPLMLLIPNTLYHRNACYCQSQYLTVENWYSVHQTMGLRRHLLVLGTHLLTSMNYDLTQQNNYSMDFGVIYTDL